MIRSLSALALAILLVASAAAADVKYALTGENTKITFIGTKPGGKHDGGFKKLTGTATVTDGDDRAHDRGRDRHATRSRATTRS